MSITFGPVADFHTLATGEATNIIYGQLIPICEKKGIMLSRYGNHAGDGSISGIDRYVEQKAQKKLFDVPRIQKAFASLSDMMVVVSQYKTGSYGLKHIVERYQKEYITNGDLIVAMLMKGHMARFGKRGESLNVNCEFKVKVKVDEEKQ